MSFKLYTKIDGDTPVATFAEYRKAMDALRSMSYGRIDHCDENLVVKLKDKMVYRPFSVIHTGVAMKGVLGEKPDSVVLPGQLSWHMFATSQSDIHKALSNFDPFRPEFYPLTQEFKQAVESALLSITP
jgi:hypothetical protein